MVVQLSTTGRNAMADALETHVTTAPDLEIRSGTPPANCAAADTGTLLATGALPSDWLGAAAGGAKALAGAWNYTGQAGAGGGTAPGHYRIKKTGTCHIQGTCGPSVALNTSALTAVNGNVLTFASTTGVVVGHNVSGTGIPADTQVVAVTATTVTLSRTSTAGVASGAAITFAPDLVINSPTISNGQTGSVTSYTFTAGGA
jgi:hypothetical protein